MDGQPWACQSPRRRHFRVHTAQASGSCARALSPAGAACGALPRSKPPRFPGPPQGRRPRWTVCFVPFSGARRVHYPRWAVRLMHLPSPGLSVSQVCPGGAVPDEPCVSSAEPLSACDSPDRSQPSRIPGRRGYQRGACSGVVDDAVSGAKMAAAPCLAAPAVAQPPLSLCGGGALYGSFLLSSGICSIVCSVSMPGVTMWN